MRIFEGKPKEHDFPSIEEISSLLINNKDFESINAHLNIFNPIQVMGMEAMEIRHSAILSWLLDPHETHQLGDKFLRIFLATALKDQNQGIKPNALDIWQGDLTDIEVRREWLNIDILLISQRERWVFIIENKFHSRQHNGQLSKYRKRIKNLYQSTTEKRTDFNIQGIFLTLQDEEPQDSTYIPIHYAQIHQILSEILNRNHATIDHKVIIFIQHYINILANATGMNTEDIAMQSLARDLYIKHRKALDYIIQYGAITRFSEAIEHLFSEKNEAGYIEIENVPITAFTRANSSQSFLPSDWINIIHDRWHEIPDCKNYWAGYPIICWIELRENKNNNAKSSMNGKLFLHVEIGPIADFTVRNSLIDTIEHSFQKLPLTQNKLFGFTNSARSPSARYSRFFKQNSQIIEDINDSEEIERKIKSLIRKFRPLFEIITIALKEFSENQILEN